MLSRSDDYTLDIDLGNLPATNRLIALADLKPHPRNYNRHSEAQIARIAKSLATFGQTRSIVVWRMMILAGHGVVEAARSLGWQMIRADVLPDEYPEEKALGYVVADNELARQSDPDQAQLAAILSELNEFDSQIVEAAGYGQQELEQLLKLVGAGRQTQDAEPQVDRAEELRQKWGVQSGDLWQLGEHRLICGDCTDAAVVARVMGDDEADLILADPPYGVNIVAANGYVGGGEGPNGMIPFGGKKARGYVGGGERIKARTGLYPIETWGQKKRLGSTNGAKPFGSADVRGSDRAANIVDVGKYAPVIGDETTATALKASSFYLAEYPDAVQVWWGANYYVEGLGPSSCWVVWDKETTGNFADCELAWTNQDKAAKLFRHRWNGMLRDSERERRWHPTQKPAALAAWVFAEFTDLGAVIIDPFAGAGWAVLGGEQSGRKVRAIEMSEDYIAVILQRYADATGIAPVRLEGG